MKSKRWILWSVLVIALFTLAGCGVPMEGVQDLSVTQPSGPWQTFVVWPLARSLVWLDSLLQGWGVPWHWGFAIILFTFLIKIITLPLTISQIRGMNAQRAIQPKIQELQKKYGNDRNKIAQEQMRLYQEAGVNPLSGCLPLLIQMPILFGLYAALVAIGPYLKDAAFIWIPDLAFPTARHGMGWLTEAFSAGSAIYEPTGIGGYATLVSYLILPILLMVTQFIMQKYMTPTPPSADPQVKTTQQITLIMTFMFGFFTLQVPAGLTLYWVTSNLLQMGQTWFMMRQTARIGAGSRRQHSVGCGDRKELCNQIRGEQTIRWQAEQQAGDQGAARSGFDETHQQTGYRKGNHCYRKQRESQKSACFRQYDNTQDDHAKDHGKSFRSGRRIVFLRYPKRT